jgi:hypothetical protein
MIRLQQARRYNTKNLLTEQTPCSNRPSVALQPVSNPETWAV